MDEQQLSQTMAPIVTVGVKRAMSYGLTVAAAALGIKEGWDLAWVAPASVVLGMLVSACLAKLLNFTYQKISGKQSA